MNWPTVIAACDGEVAELGIVEARDDALEERLVAWCKIARCCHVRGGGGCLSWEAVTAQLNFLTNGGVRLKAQTCLLDLKQSGALARDSFLATSITCDAPIFFSEVSVDHMNQGCANSTAQGVRIVQYGW